MDPLSLYPDIIEKTLLDYARIPSSTGDVQYQSIFDRGHGHYLLVQVGWGRQRRIYGTLAHIDLIGDKVWIQHDGTEEGLANQLQEAGIAADHIVLGYRIPEIRQHTGFAVA